MKSVTTKDEINCYVYTLHVHDNVFNMDAYDLYCDDVGLHHKSQLS